MSNCCNQLADLDRDWQNERLRWLDWDREPQPIQFFSIAITVTWFTALLSLLQFVNGSALGPAISAVAVLVLFSPRAKYFEAAFLAYQRRRETIMLRSST